MWEISSNGMSSAPAHATTTNADAVESWPDTSTHTNPVDEQCCGASGRRHLAFDDVVAVNEVHAFKHRIADGDYG